MPIFTQRHYDWNLILECYHIRSNSIVKKNSIQSTVGNEVSSIGYADTPTGLVKQNCKPLVTQISHGV